jgi:hypothetical protein
MAAIRLQAMTPADANVPADQDRALLIRLM